MSEELDIYKEELKKEREKAALDRKKAGDIAISTNLDYEDSGEFGQFNISLTRERYKEIARYHVNGYPNTQIAENLDLSTRTISRALNHPLMKILVANMSVKRDASASDFQSRLKDETRIKELGDKSLDVIEEILNDPEESSINKLRAAELGSRTKREAAAIHIHTTTGDVFAGAKLAEMFETDEKIGGDLDAG